MFETIIAAALAILSSFSTGDPETAAPIVCGEAREDTAVTRIAADEIFRLTSEGYPACEVEWIFQDGLPGSDAYLGLAYDNQNNSVQINTRTTTYTNTGKPLDAYVRHVVRHEFGHQITYVNYPATGGTATDRELAYLFTGDHQTLEGYEVAADAIAAALSDDREAYAAWQIDLAQSMLDNTPTLY